jgi:hypothetical protein
MLGSEDGDECPLADVDARESKHGFWWGDTTKVTAATAALEERKRAKNQREADLQATRDAEFALNRAEAARTSKPVVLARWTTDRCMNGHSDECSFDNATKSLMPDGTTRTTYSCCY